MNGNRATRRTSWTRKLSGAVTLSLLAAVTLVVAGPSAGADVVINGCTIVSAPTSTTHTSCPGADLSGVDLSHLDLDYADLDHADLRGATAPSTWQHGDIEYADLTGATGIGGLYSMDAAHVIMPGQSLEVIQGDFTGADLDHLGVVFDGDMIGTFDGADLESMGGCCTMEGSFRGANLRNAGFGGGGIEGLGIHQADLTGADLTGMSIDGTLGASNLTDANLTDTQFTDASLGGNTYTGSIWTGSNALPTAPPVQSTDGIGAIVTFDGVGSLNISGLTVTCDRESGQYFLIGVTTVNCTPTDPYTGTHGTGTFDVVVVGTTTIDGCTVVADPTPTVHTSCSGDDLSGIDLPDFDLSYADFSGADLTGADLTQTKLVGADLSGATVTSAHLFQADLSGADVTNANFTLADARANFNGAAVAGANFTQARLGDFSNTILAVSNRTYGASQSDGRVTSWRAPPGLASVTGVSIGSCSPPHGSLLSVGVNAITCALKTQSPGTPGTMGFTITILPVVQPGAGVVAAPTSGTSDLQITVTLNAPVPASGTVTIPWTTLHVAGSPTFLGLPQAPTSDYTPTSGTVTLTGGQTTAVIHIPVTADSATDAEFLVVSFHDPSGALIGGFYGLGFGFITPAT